MVQDCGEMECQAAVAKMAVWEARMGSRAAWKVEGKMVARAEDAAAGRVTDLQMVLQDLTEGPDAAPPLALEVVPQAMVACVDSVAAAMDAVEMVVVAVEESLGEAKEGV